MRETKTIGLYFISGARKSYNIAKMLALGGCRVIVRVEETEAELSDESKPAYVERQYCALLYRDEDIEVVSNIADAPPVDALLYELCRQPARHPDELAAWMRRAPKVAAWNSSWHESGAWTDLKSEIDIVVKFARFLPHTRAVVMHNGRISWRPTAIFSRAFVQGGFVHPLFLHGAAMRHEIYGGRWCHDARRGIHLIFAGDADSPRRRALVPQLRHLVERQPDVRMITTYDDALIAAPAGARDKAVLWLAVEAGGRQQIPMEQWPAILRNCDFCLCPPGYEQKSHRVIECLLQGAIPIVHCPEDYDIDMRDGENCILVHDGDWAAATARAMNCDERDIQRLRAGVASLVDVHLTPQAVARRWLHFMGFGLKPSLAATDAGQLAVDMAAPDRMAADRRR